MPAAPDVSQELAAREAARTNEYDRYLAALLAPKAARRHLIALAAFLGEVARAVETVNEPIMGEIRLQWWRDALPALSEGVSTGNPLADALGETMRAHALSEQSVLTILDANSRALEPGYPAGEKDVSAYLRDSDGTALQLAARILGVGTSEAADGLLAAAAQSSGRVRLLRALPLTLSHGRHAVPAPAGVSDAHWAAAAEPVIHAARAWLGEARMQFDGAGNGAIAAVLPLALVEPYLTALQDLGPDIVRRRAEISPLARVWRLWRASVLGRV
jgi:15-cis-phytoene synthase